jgi:hypothetical protein
MYIYFCGLGLGFECQCSCLNRGLWNFRYGLTRRSPAIRTNTENMIPDTSPVINMVYGFRFRSSSELLGPRASFEESQLER